MIDESLHSGYNNTELIVLSELVFPKLDSALDDHKSFHPSTDLVEDSSFFTYHPPCSSQLSSGLGVSF